MNDFETFEKQRMDFISKHLIGADNLAKLKENESIKNPLIKYFESKYFKVITEKFDDSRKYRFDIILYHITDKENHYPIIIECKRDGRKKGGELAKWCLQCKNYSDTFIDKKQVSVFVAPQISFFYLVEGSYFSPHNPLSFYHSNTNSFLFSAFNFGEVLKIGTFKKKIILCANNKKIWDSENPQSFDFDILKTLFKLN